MKNVIEGYGDAYLVPGMSLLDELADEFGFEEAGARLKTARETTRNMVRLGQASACDYVEEVRRRAACEFVLDAFNGKVEAILSDVRHDNFGTLQRKIVDAAFLVNRLGIAFRNARIANAYVESRLAELKWAEIVHQLKVKQREEQRELREEMRDEERAQREYEKALKDAAKEEELIRKGMQKAQEAMAKANDGQREIYEAKLRELSERLASAEANKRAISLAQQTRAGNVYVISNVGSFGENVFKIGMTRRHNPEERVWELGDASVPFDFDIHAMIKCADAPALEHALHKKFLTAQVNKVNPRKEFFRLSVEAIRAEIEQLGLQTNWTMTAACQEWRETQAVERALAEKSGNAKAWEREQLKEIDREVPESGVVELEGQRTA